MNKAIKYAKQIIIPNYLNAVIINLFILYCFQFSTKNLSVFPAKDLFLKLFQIHDIGLF